MTSSMKTPGDSEIFACSKHVGMVLNSMYTLLKSQQLCDVILITEDHKRVTGHRLVLAATSEYFRIMFTGSMRESKEKEIPLKEIKGEDLEKLVQFCYTGSIVLREDNVLSLLSSANLLRFDTVVTACGEFLDRHLYPSNCLGISVFAEQHNLKTLQRNAEKYICQHFTKVCKTAEFSQLTSDELHNILVLDNIVVDTDEIIFNSLMSWIEYDKENREQYFHGFLSDSIKLRKLKPTFICEYVEPECKTTESKLIVLEALKWHILSEKTLNKDGCCNSRKSNVSLIAFTASETNKQVLRYCTQTNKWASGTDCILPIVNIGGVALMENTIFIVGGSGDNRMMYSVDIKTMHCVELSRWNSNRIGMGFAALDGLLYPVGGSDGRTSNTVERWDPKTNIWSNVSPMLYNRRDLRVVALDGLLYAVGGFTDFCLINTMECYDPRTNKWTLKAPMNFIPDNFDVAACGGFLYVVNGGTKSVERYNPATNTWSSVCLRNTASTQVRCTALSGRLLVADHFANVEEYDSFSNKWKSSKTIPVGSMHLYDLLTVQI